MAVVMAEIQARDEPLVESEEPPPRMHSTTEQNSEKARMAILAACQFWLYGTILGRGTGTGGFGTTEDENVDGW
jgi:hypothetical protein